MTDTGGRGPIDAHLHLWDLAVSDYAWLGPQHGDLFRSWTAGEAAVELVGAGVAGAVLVQAEDSRADTRHLLRIAAEQEWVLGVVGWLQLDDIAATARDLDEWAAHPKFVGVRHLLNDDPRADFLELPAVRAGLAELARRGLPFDVHDAWPRHLDRAAALAGDLPELTVVLDHLGKPPPRVGGPAGAAGAAESAAEFDDWRAALTRLARHPLAVAKVSGLQGPAFSVDTARPAFDAALEAFGADRLMWGGDWPLTVPAGGYGPAFAVYSALVAELSPTERHSILRGTATRVYRLHDN